MASFLQGDIKIMVCTDIVSRGVDTQIVSKPSIDGLYHTICVFVSNTLSGISSIVKMVKFDIFHKNILFT